MNRMNQQLKKGVLEVIILQLLAEENMYGYQITKTLQQYKDLRISEGTLYPLLYRLEDAELLETNWVNKGGASKPKKYYAITALGLQALAEEKQEWFEFIKEVGMILKEDD